jgi:hypothetical protein
VGRRDFEDNQPREEYIMSAHKMPLAWFDNRLAHNPDQMITTYRFQPDRDDLICEFPGLTYRSFDPYSLAAMLVADGHDDGTVQFKRGRRWPFERDESLHGMSCSYAAVVSISIYRLTESRRFLGRRVTDARHSGLVDKFAQ